MMATLALLCQRKNLWKTLKIVVAVVLLTVLVILLKTQTAGYRFKPGEQVESESLSGDDASWIPHLCPHYRRRRQRPQPLQWEPPSNYTIYFTQTSCRDVLTVREACAVESASLHHPHRPILVFLTAPDPDRDQPLLKMILGLGNVRLAWLDLDQVFDDEKLREWHQDRQWMFSEGRTFAEVSDAVRAEMLRRFGGTFVDLDAITLRSLPSSNNWLGRLDSALVNTAISSFVPGHPVLQSVVDNIPSSFDPYGCCSIGPNLFTRILHQECPKNVTIPSSADPDQAERCHDVTIFPSSYFYPIHYGYERDQLESIFREGEGLGPAFLSKTRAFSLHLFNSLSSKRKVSLSGDSVLKEVAERNCPKVFLMLRERNMVL
ncbi:alpha-1,4-N-acetylglucosaminyltransferase-like [Penaeus japonicus]|uniref:alpha-1,4-N-acetylglucosaminyltransferase-like n=1 Tax=Penaeus japonicus TaxID=27405 RepID=UPI001C712414|nr:alpha-1,4-N-acetylglucosaminyltransferase-like [Penaeus japonicus]